MSDNGRAHTARIHPRIYRAVIGLASLYLLAVWFGFSGSGYTDYLLVVVTGFIALCIGLVETARRVGGKHRRSEVRQPSSFRLWMKSRVDVADRPIKGHDAAIEMLLPLAAVAFGMFAFGLLTQILA